MIDLKNTYVLVQDYNSGKLYKAPIEAFGGMFLLNNGDNDVIKNIIEQIDILSVTILQVSAYLSDNCYTMEEITKKFEMISSTNYISCDPKILKLDQIYKYPANHDLIKYEDAEAAFMNVEGEIDQYFSKLDKESDSYF